MIIPIPLAFAMVPGAGFSLSSPDFEEGGRIKDLHVFNSFGCSGLNRSPELRWSGLPVGTRSLALIVHDPDAPTGIGGFTHWIVYNVPASANGLPGNAGTADGQGLPSGAVQATSSFGIAQYGGPCPPPGHGDHRYVFTLYALKVESLQIPANATQAVAGFMINSQALDTAVLTGVYGR